MACKRTVLPCAWKCWPRNGEARVTRVGEPEDIAGLVAFIASPAGRFLHGALIDMDGGATKTL